MYRGENLVLTDEDLKYNAPSIFATRPYHEVSDKYKFIPTIEVVNNLRQNNFFPVKASQSKARLEGKREFTKHLIRFRQGKDLGVGQGKEVFELVLVNSHDRTSSYQLMLGIYRLVCANGLIIGDTLSKIRTIHRGQGNLVKDIIEASYGIIQDTPKIERKVNAWKGIELSPEKQLAFAKSALELNPSSLEIQPNRILQARRCEDKPNVEGNRNLWNTFNVIQENFIKGGSYGQNKKGKFRRTRAIKAVSTDVKLNKALWTLTEEMEKILTK